MSHTLPQNITSHEHSIPVTPRVASQKSLNKGSHDHLNITSGNRLVNESGFTDAGLNDFVTGVASHDNPSPNNREVLSMEPSDENFEAIIYDSSPQRIEVTDKTSSSQNSDDNLEHQEENVSDNKTRRILSGPRQKRVLLSKQTKAPGKLTTLPKPLKKRPKRIHA